MITRFLPILMCLFITSLTYPQELDLTGGGYGSRLRLQHILPDEGKLGHAEITNVRTTYYSKLNSSINYGGKVLILNNQLIKNKETHFRKIDFPNTITQTFRGTLLSQVNDILVIKESFTDLNPNRTLHFFDIITDTKIYGYNSSSLSFAGLMINSNASSFIYLNNEGIITVNRINDMFESTVVNSGYVRQDIRYFSSSGDRIFFFGREQALDDSKWYIIDRLETGWSEPRELQVFDKQNNELHFGLVDIANNGRTLLITNSEIGYSLTHEVNGIWNLPRSTGYIPIPYDSAQISENGKVIKIQTAKRITEIDRFYDVIVLLQNSAEQWIQHQVNDPQLEVHDGILLSGDGTKLYWLPANTSHIPNALEYK